MVVEMHDIQKIKKNKKIDTIPLLLFLGPVKSLNHKQVSKAARWNQNISARVSGWLANKDV